MEDTIMNEEEVMDTEMDTIDMEPEDSGMSTGVAMLIGAGITLAVGAAVKLGKKGIDYIKAKKALRKPEEGSEVEVTDDDIEKVTK